MEIKIMMEQEVFARPVTNIPYQYHQKDRQKYTVNAVKPR